jgi:predicted lipoprotein
VPSLLRLAALVLPVLVLACKVATVRPIESTREGEGVQELDVAARARLLWTDDVPVALDRAVDLGELLPAVATDPETAGERWGRREGSGFFNVIVKGSGRVVDVDTSSRVGTATVEIDISGQPEHVRLQIGPVLRGTSVRDALPTVSFDQFVNQIQFADVAGALNARVEGEILGSLDREDLVGKRVRFAGAVTLDEERPLTVTPLRLELEEYE